MKFRNKSVQKFEREEIGTNFLGHDESASLWYGLDAFGKINSNVKSYFCLYISDELSLSSVIYMHVSIQM